MPELSEQHRRALELMAEQPEGCSEAILAANEVEASTLINLLEAELIQARGQHAHPRKPPVKTWWITAKGRLALK
jgi:hypothetical protein